MSAISIGIQVENLAVAYLQKQNFAILQRNFHCKFGELDIIGQHDNNLVFVEVRYRKYATFGSAAESVNFNKQQKLIRTAEYYLQTKEYTSNKNCRFDVIAVSNNIQSTQIEWIKDAFNA